MATVFQKHLKVYYLEDGDHFVLHFPLEKEKKKPTVSEINNISTVH